MASKFRVIIIGGGVAGLTLANALEKAKVDYVLLESKDEFSPIVGASIAMGANGNRILDQLGCCKYSYETTLPWPQFAMLDCLHIL
jgi:2-polyprenyl-6-methoxyphenol hydroxylase-like FAD-dependent oxidoreductase